MTSPSSEYRARQEEQLTRYLEWTRSQPDAHELPTRLSTIFAHHQVARMNWLKSNSFGMILEVGCNWGAVLAWVSGHAGVDISPGPLELARLLAPEREFHEGDARDLHFYRENAFTTVMLPEVLEHLTWPDDVYKAVTEACRVAEHRVLITMPDGRTNSQEATSFKHQFLADTHHISQIASWFPKRSRVYTAYNDGFALIRADL